MRRARVWLGLAAAGAVHALAGCAAGPARAGAIAGEARRETGLFSRVAAGSAGDPSVLTVQATARRFFWTFAYGEAPGVLEPRELVVPAGRTVRFVLRSMDEPTVLALPGLRDDEGVRAEPGRTTELWARANAAGSGTTRCAGACSHDLVRDPYEHPVRVGTEAEYARALRVHEEPPEGQSVPQWGAALFRRFQCSTCHTTDGTLTMGPSMGGMWGSTVTLQDGATVRVDGDAGRAYVLRSMEEPSAQVVRGYAPIMPSYRAVASRAELEALTDYVRSLAGP